MAGAIIATICGLAVKQLPIPVEVKDLATYIIGVLSGCLIKTGVDNVTGEINSPAPDNAEPSEPEPTDPDSPPKTDPLSKTFRKSTQ